MKTFLVLAILGKVAAVATIPGGTPACEALKIIKQGAFNTEFQVGGGKVKVEGTDIILLPYDVQIDCYESNTPPEIDMEWGKRAP